MAGTETDPNNPIGSTINNLTSGIQGFFNKIFGEGGMLRNIFNGIFGQGGILGNLLSGVFGQNGIFSQLLQGLFGGATGGGGFFSSILSFVGSIFTGTPMVAAQGGMVHMAQGGLLSAGSQLRDRVPSLLEPGEFVVRKPAARQIGVPALQAMNATGQVPNAGNVTVNITNKGTPQDAQASQPRFDGEKYVIDIVTRDLANNGPIRRTLRGK
jgi:hypothetical protein